MTKPTGALLLIDFFNPTGFDECPGLASAALAAARHVIELKARSRRTRVIYVNDNFGSWSDEFRSLAHACQRLPGDAGKLARLLKPEPGDWVVLKPRHWGVLRHPARDPARRVADPLVDSGRDNGGLVRRDDGL